MTTKILEKSMGIPRRVYVNAMAGGSATVVVTVVQGKEAYAKRSLKKWSARTARKAVV